MPVAMPRSSGAVWSATIAEIEKDENGLPWMEALTGNSNVILIAEDNKDIIDYLKTVFDKEFKVLEANNGTDAFRMVTEKLPDIVLSDIMMPGIDGVELCKRIKTDEKTCHIPVILLTAKAGEENVNTGLEHGADDYIIKPLSLDSLEEKVFKAVEKTNSLPPMDFHIKMARRFKDTGELEEAIKEVKLAKKSDPKAGKPVRELGHYYFIKNHLSEAEKQLLTAVRMNPFDGFLQFSI